MGRRKKYKPCELCGGLMEKGGAGYICSNCHNIEWYTKETTSMSSVAKCPHCGSVSPNLNYCVICGGKIDE